MARLTTPEPIPSNTGSGTSYRGYWRALLFWGVVLSAIGYGLIADWESSTTSFDYLNSTGTSGRSGAEAGFGFLIAALGGLLLVPGMIGWGIHASGLTRPTGNSGS